MSAQDTKIYLLPNLMTAGNLFCGFAAILSIFEGMLNGGMSSLEETSTYYIRSIWLILGACFFDLIDGRIARISGQESEFGGQFDSLADIVSFGVAPALLVMNVVLYEFDNRTGWVIAFVYLLCGAMRLARFNCQNEKEVGDDRFFIGVPIPAAAGVIASLTLMLLWLADDHPKVLFYVKFSLPVLMLLLSYLMFSQHKFPSFKKVNWKTKRSIPVVLAIGLLLAFTVMNIEWMPAVLFLLYILYGLVRPWISRRWQREIESSFEDDDLEDEEESSLGSH